MTTTTATRRRAWTAGDQRRLEALAARETLTPREIAARLGWSLEAIQRHWPPDRPPLDL